MASAQTSGFIALALAPAVPFARLRGIEPPAAHAPGGRERG
ncbi:hypothetical protein [Streptomyces uncialis]|nr:hypothetical protein OG268_07675 [Streptomyces uncialis]